MLRHGKSSRLARDVRSHLVPSAEDRRRRWRSGRRVSILGLNHRRQKPQDRHTYRCMEALILWAAPAIFGPRRLLAQFAFARQARPRPAQQGSTGRSLAALRTTTVATV